MTATYDLNDGTTVPVSGFGTYPLTGADGIEAIVSALQAGYRYLDTAVNYGNEAEVGEAVRRFVDGSDVPRHDIRVATKIPGRFHATELALRSLADSARTLGVDQLDVALIHWPNPSQDLYSQAWQALVRAQKDGLVRTIGVSNFTQAHLTRIIDDTSVVPAVNQLELHPMFPQVQMRAVNADLGILTQAWSPLGKRKAPFGKDVVEDASNAHGVTPAQVVLRWHRQIGSMPLPKSATPERQRANLDIDGFTLTEAEMDGLATVADAHGRLFGGDPDTHEEM